MSWFDLVTPIEFIILVYLTFNTLLILWVTNSLNKIEKKLDKLEEKTK
jgi:hypothetical protein